MAEVKISDVVGVLQAVERYFMLTLLKENLTPDAAMGSEDVLTKVQELMEKLEKGASLAYEAKTLSAESTNDHVNVDLQEEELYDDAAAVTDTGAEMDELEAEQGDYEAPGDILSAGDENEPFSKPAPSNGPEKQDSIAQIPIEETNESLEKFLQARLDSLGQITPAEAKKGCWISGILSKHKRKMFTKWHKRFCVVKESLLFYFKSETENKERGVIVLPFYSISIDVQSKYSFKLTPLIKGRDTYQFMADSVADFERWYTTLQQICSKSLSKHDKEVMSEVAKELDIQNQSNESGSTENSGGESITPFVEMEQETYDDIADMNKAAEEANGDEYEVAVDVDETAEEANDKQHEISEDQETYDDLAGPDTPEQPEPMMEDLYEDIPAALMMQQKAPLLERPTELNIGSAWTPPPLPKRKQHSVSPPELPVRVPKTPAEENREVTDGQATAVQEFDVDNLYIGSYDCTADGQDELEFREGDYIYILDRIDVNWWVGYLHGKVGLVPKSYVEPAFYT